MQCRNAASACPARFALWLSALITAPALALDPGERFHDYVLDNWTIEHGLPQISALSITQDHQGYLWIGTQNGIARFDGVRFVVFNRQNSGVDTTMASSAISDRRGNTWFGTPHGALRYADGRFTALAAGPDRAAVNGIAEAADGSVLFATSIGVMRYSDQELQPAMLDGQPCFSVLRLGDAIWIGGIGALTRVDARDAKRYELPVSAAGVRVTRIVSSPEGLWLGTSTGLYRWKDGTITPADLGPELAQLGIESLLRDGDGNLWIGTAPTLFRLRPNRELERIGSEEFVRDSWVTAAFEDREGNLWLGSQTESLFRLWNGWARRISQRDGLSDPFVWSIVRDPRGRIVLGTNSNIAVLTDHGAEELISGKRLPNPAAYELFYDESGRLWIGTRGGLTLYANGSIAQPPALAALDPYQINAISQVGADDYWIATMGGLYRYRGATLERVGPPPGAAAARVRAIFPLTPDELLIGTESGLRHVHGDAVDLPSWAAALDGLFVTYIAPIRPDLLGIATLDAGLGLMSDQRLLLLTPELGLPNGNAWTFRVVDGRLYVAGIEGVWRLPVEALPDPARGTAHAVNPEMVLSSSGRERGSQRARCCNGGAASRSLADADGIWVASISGALRIDTKAIAAPQQPPSVVVEGLRHAGRWYPAAASLALPDGSRDVEIEFTGLSFRDPRSLRFRYRLEGYDADWIDAGARRAAFYTNLPPRDYRFRVEATLPSGQTSAAQSTLEFDLPPRWYERATVRAATGATAVALIALLLLVRLRRYRALQRELETTVAKRTHELRRANKRLREANQVLAQESQTDPLTGLHNRRFLLDHIQGFAAGVGDDGNALAFLLLDLDNFKRVNDSFGHAAGDNVLVQISELLQGIARSDDHLLRWGGEEFLILLKRVRAGQALETAERIRAAVAQHAFRIGAARELRVTCSIGFALFPLTRQLRATMDWTLTLELADAALYRIKQEGRNGCAGLVAGPSADGASFARHIGTQLDALIAEGALRWLRPLGPAQIRAVR